MPSSSPTSVASGRVFDAASWAAKAKNDASWARGLVGRRLLGRRLLGHRELGGCELGGCVLSDLSLPRPPGPTPATAGGFLGRPEPRAAPVGRQRRRRACSASRQPARSTPVELAADPRRHAGSLRLMQRTRGHPFGGTDRVFPERGCPAQRPSTFRGGLLSAAHQFEAWRRRTRDGRHRSQGVSASAHRYLARRRARLRERDERLPRNAQIYFVAVAIIGCCSHAAVHRQTADDAISGRPSSSSPRRPPSRAPVRRSHTGRPGVPHRHRLPDSGGADPAAGAARARRGRPDGAGVAEDALPLVPADLQHPRLLALGHGGLVRRPRGSILEHAGIGNDALRLSLAGLAACVVFVAVNHILLAVMLRLARGFTLA